MPSMAQQELDRLKEQLELIHQQAARVKDVELYPSIRHTEEIAHLLEMIAELDGDCE